MIHIKTFEQSKNNSLELIEAAYDNDLEKVKELLKDQNIDVNFQDIFGYTALIWASRKDHLEIVKELLKQPNINVNIQDDYRDTALIKASFAGHLDTVKELLKQPNINWNLKNIEGNDFLMDLRYKKEIINLYPDGYKKYLLFKKTDEYNL